MPTVVVSEGIRVAVNTRDHQPPHVHAYTGSGEVLVYLDAGKVPRWDAEPGVTKSDARKAVTIVEEYIQDCWAMWRRYHP